MSPWRWALLCALVLAAIALHQHGRAATRAAIHLYSDWRVSAIRPRP